MTKKITASDNTIETMEAKTTRCTCGECFYCYINQPHFHTENLGELRSVQLVLNIAEYVGPEVTRE